LSFEWKAALVVCEGVERSISFDDRPERHEQYVILQRGEESPEQPVPDLKNIYIERDDQCMGGWGGIDRVLLERNSLTILLSPRMAERLGGHDWLRISFDLGEERFDELRHVLTSIMRGYEERLLITS